MEERDTVKDIKKQVEEESLKDAHCLLSGCWH